MKCTLHYQYTESGIKIFVSKGSDSTGISVYIDYSKWSENRLQYLDKILDKYFNELTDCCNQSILNYKLNNKDVENTKLNVKNTIIRIVKENDEKLRNLITKLDISIKSWYLKEYPSDDVGETLSDTATFLELNNLLNSGKGKDVYELLGGDSDTIVRERCFEKLCQLTDQTYDTVYNKWLHTEESKTEEYDIEK